MAITIAARRLVRCARRGNFTKFRVKCLLHLFDRILLHRPFGESVEQDRGRKGRLSFHHWNDAQAQSFSSWSCRRGRRSLFRRCHIQIAVLASSLTQHFNLGTVKPNRWFSCIDTQKPIGLPIYLPTYIHTTLQPSIHPPTHTSIHPSIHPSIHAAIHPRIHTYIPTYLPTYLPTYIHTYIHTYTKST